MRITKKDLKIEIENLKTELSAVKQSVITNELQKLRREKLRLDEQDSLLKDVKFRVKSVKAIDNETGQTSIVITYQLPIITLPLDEKGNPTQKIPFFYAVNALGLIGMEDYEKISRILEQAKNNKNKN